jgi:hypothetical protein
MRLLNVSLVLIVLTVYGVGSLHAAGPPTEHVDPTGADATAQTLGEWIALYKPMFEKRCAEWREVVADDEKFDAFYENQDELQHLMRCQLLYIHHCEKIAGGRIGGPHPARQKLILEYRKWLDDKGWEMMLRWRKGGLKDDEKKLIPVLQVGYVQRGALELPHAATGRPLFNYDRKLSAQAVKAEGRRKLDPDEEACVAYVGDMVKRCEAAKVKALSGKALDEADIDSMRVVCMMDRMRNMAPGDPFPYKDYGAVPPMLRAGVKNAELPLPKLEAALASPTYTDRYPRHPYDIYFPESAYWVLRGLEAFRLSDKGKVETKPKAWAAILENPDFFNISDYRGKKIVVLAYAGLLNDDDNHGRHMLQTTLDRVYGDKVEFIFMYSHLGTGEQWFQYPNYFGAPTDYSRIGTLGMEFFGSSPVTREELARDVKLSLMLYPNLTHTHTFSMPNGLPAFPVIEPQGNNGHGGLIIIDIDGTVAYHETKHRPWFHINHGYLREHFYLPLLETELRRMIANGGRVVAGMQERLRILDLKKWPTPKGAKLESPVHASGKATYVFRSYAPEGQAVTVRKLAKGKEGPDMQFKVMLDRNRRGYTIGHLNNVEMAVTDFRRGDQVHLVIYKYPDAPERYVSMIGMRHRSARGPYAESFEKYSHYREQSYWRNPNWVAGDVESVDMEKRIVRLKRRVPPREKMHGYRFIKEAGVEAKLWGYGKRNYDHLCASLREYDESPQVTLKVVGGAYVFHNGDYQRDALTQIAKGDTICYQFIPKDPADGTTYTGNVRTCTPIAADAKKQ